MITVQVNHKVQDFDKWLPLFKDHGTTRKAAGCKGAHVMSDPQDRNNVTVYMQWDSAENAQKFATSDDLKQTMKKGGVISEPNVKIYNNEGNFAN